MRIALLVGANPQRCELGPNVRLIAGCWRFEVEGLRNSVIRLHLEDEPHDLVDPLREFVLSQAATVYVDFAFRGSEPYLTVMAERVKQHVT